MAATINALLACEDLSVVTATDSDSSLVNDFGPEPRVALDADFESLSRFSPLICEVPAGLAPEVSLISQLSRSALASGEAATPDGIVMTSRRNRAVSRSQAATVDVMSGRAVSVSPISRVLGRARRIRSAQDALSAARWVIAAARRRLRVGRPPTGARPANVSVNPWARVHAPDWPQLPATGTPGGRIDLVIAPATVETQAPILDVRSSPLRTAAHVATNRKRRSPRCDTRRPVGPQLHSSSF